MVCSMTLSKVKVTSPSELEICRLEQKHHDHIELPIFLVNETMRACCFHGDEGGVDVCE